MGGKGMRALLMRRREMGLPPAPEPLPEYISDGLVLWLDGKVKGNTTDAWTDLVNGVVFTKKGSGVTFNSDNVQFGNGRNNALHNTSSYVFTNSSVGTIEVCYRDVPTSTSESHTIFYSYGNVNYSIGFSFYKGTVLFSVGNSVTKLTGKWIVGSTGTYSISNARAYQNGVNVGFNTNKDYQTRSDVAAIVGAGKGYYSALNGKIHSIRIYNRHLTEEEILHNQAIDNTRFNLGLTINS
jgi:hypothetical protein